MQRVLGPVPPGADSSNAGGGIALDDGLSVAPSDAELEQAWQGDVYGLSASAGPDDLYTLSPEFGYTTASSGVPVDYGFLPQQGIDMGTPLTDSYSPRVTGEHRRVGALEGFFTFTGVGQALSGLWDSVTSLPDMARSYAYSQIANLYDTQQLYQLAIGETDSVDFTNPITSRIQDDGSVLPILGDTIRGAVMATPIGLIDAGYRGDWYSFGQRLPSLLEAPILARGLGKAALDVPDKLSSSIDGGFYPTGIGKFDQPFSLSPQFEKISVGLERRGITLVPDRSKLDMSAGERAFVQLEKDGSGILVYDPATTPFVDILHESRHISQIQRAQKSGLLGDKSPYSSKLKPLFERGAYEYELRLGERFDFDSRYNRQLVDRVNDYYTPQFERSLLRGQSRIDLFQVIEPRLSPLLDRTQLQQRVK
ncbi:MAG: hypothetical protein KZQ97_22105 [Candidatus Thiodiazotropha sp. (ex Dulcina madagascariensis)]|nr:hypothetical protein [Candidatus Thiodiazotropha sp. (ex Dulcina madagascariensis)]